MTEYTLMEKLKQVGVDELAKMAREAIEEINREATARILMSIFDLPHIRGNAEVAEPVAEPVGEPVGEPVNFDRIWSKSMAGY